MGIILHGEAEVALLGIAGTLEHIFAGSDELDEASERSAKWSGRRLCAALENR